MFWKKANCSLSLAVVVIGLTASHVEAELVVDAWNWDNGVADCSSYLQNFTGTALDSNTQWWLTGVPDADSNNDYVAGWRSSAPDEYITMCWGSGIADIAGDDLVIRLYGGGKASAIVSASTDGTEFTQIGTIGGGSQGVFEAEYFDFGGVFAGDVSYVKVERNADGSGTGMFFDAFGAAPVPEPGAIAILATGAIALVVLRRRYRASKSC